MKKIMIITIIVSFLTGLLTSAASPDRKESRQEQYNNIVELIENGDFIFKARRAYPQTGSPIDLTTNPGLIEISEKTGEARLPFFGRAYNIPYGGRGGITFSGELKNVEVSENPDRMRVSYSFEVRDREYYQVNMNIGYNGDASVIIMSNNRAQISYHGHVSGMQDREKF
ncbi:MAG: DUF4251 domain-containing protein [Bacteroidales bacterium]